MNQPTTHTKHPPTTMHLTDPTPVEHNQITARLFGVTANSEFVRLRHVASWYDRISRQWEARFDHIKLCDPWEWEQENRIVELSDWIQSVLNNTGTDETTREL